MQNYSLARKNTEFFVSHTITAPTFADKVNVHSSSTLFDERANWKQTFRTCFACYLSPSFHFGLRRKKNRRTWAFSNEGGAFMTAKEVWRHENSGLWNYGIGWHKGERRNFCAFAVELSKKKNEIIQNKKQKQNNQIKKGRKRKEKSLWTDYLTPT